MSNIEFSDSDEALDWLEFFVRETGDKIDTWKAENEGNQKYLDDVTGSWRFPPDINRVVEAHVAGLEGMSKIYRAVTGRHMLVDAFKADGWDIERMRPHLTVVDGGKD